jgi:hypothetical protein
MLNLKIEEAADEVRAVHNLKAPPIDVVKLARDEGIVLAPSPDYGPEFNGRIEFRRDKQKFILFYPTQADGSLTRRHRFSLGHELGHYYLEAHREALIQGTAHSSTPGFICRESFEREADEFAASLMIPQRFIESRLGRRDFMDLKSVLALADECQTSSQCAAIRYVTFTGEPCSVILSCRGKICFNVASDDSCERGFSYVSRIPSGAAVTLATSEPRTIKERSCNASEWFDERWADPRAHEESYGLGYGDLVLTLLSLDVCRED